MVFRFSPPHIATGLLPKLSPDGLPTIIFGLVCTSLIISAVFANLLVFV